MKKRFLCGILCAVLLLSEAALLTGCSQNDNGGETYVVWCAENLVNLTRSQLDRYNRENNTSYKFEVSPVGESDAANNMLTDVRAGADIYCFAQDQLARLVYAGALTEISAQLAQAAKAENDDGSIRAASSGDKLYAFPLTSDNGYFMYYDKRVLSNSDISDQSRIISVCRDAGKTVAFELVGSAFYSSSYFFGTGCRSEWKTDERGQFISHEDDFNSDRGIIACRGMAELIGSPVFVNSSATSSFSSDAAVVVSGIWGYETAKNALGDNLGCAPLWSFKVDDKEYHLGSFSGNKLIGVKPQTDGDRAAVCLSVASYLSGEECQGERFESLSWGPSNKKVQASDKVKANAGLVALAEQNQHATPQGQYPTAWWDIARAVPAAILELGSTSPSVDSIKPILEQYESEIGKAK